MSDIVVDGRTRVAWVPTIANIQEPTEAELNAGTLIHDLLIPTGLEGFEASPSSVDNSAFGSTFDTSLPGRDSYSNTALVLKKQAGVDAVFALLSARDTDGFVVIRNELLRGADWDSDQPLEVYPVRTGTHSFLNRGEKNTVLRYRIPTPISSQPALHAAVA
ncbi:hypothetical protein [Nocardioides sp. R-C-SC26]|uniref:phage tail tube protein n=1 Tax=Nocardioides sp. R-C-SC26 TaxID=2870414 RepID=UPI001E43125C|nr:hypothetical protein [Nocardioides sp. R-C-SC26]